MGVLTVCGRCRASATAVILTFLLSSLTANPVLAATRNVPADFPTVQAAVDAASSGDIILLAPGTYLGGVFVNGKSVRIVSRFHTTGDTSYIAQTVLSGVASGMCTGRTDCTGNAIIEFGTSAHGSAVIGLTITNGTDGIRSRSMADISYCRVIATGDGTDYSGGGGGVFSNSLFANNRDDGIDLNGRVDVQILDNIIRDNGDDGIEFRLQGYSGPVLTTVITGNRITGNREDGIQLIDYSDNSSRIVHIEGNYFSNNTDAAVGVMGGGDTVEDLGGYPMPERVRLYRNTFRGEHNGFVGGANVIALNNIFTGVSASALRRVRGNSIASYNLFWNNGTNSDSSNVDATHTLVANPLLAADGRLNSGSPAIDAGIAFFQWQGQTVLDLPASAYRGSAPDLGAFEFSSDPDPPPPPPATLTIVCAASTTASCPTLPSFGTPTVTGACQGSPTLTFDDVTTAGACPGTSTVTRTWTASDACGRTAQCSQTIQIRDVTPPTISGVGAAWTIDCGVNPVFSEPSARDDCDAIPALSFSDVTTPGTCAGSRIVTRTWMAVDDCGNSATASQSITVRDRTAPQVVSCPPNASILCGAVVAFDLPSFTDSCDNDLTVTSTDEELPATCPAGRVVRRTWTASDDCGNSSRCSQTLTIIDQSAPVISGVGGATTIDCPANPSFGTPTVTDACDAAPRLTFADVSTPGACAGQRVVTRTWTATDACGNSATASRTITVRDRTAPVVVSSPADGRVDCPAPVVFGEPVFEDACDPNLSVTFEDQELSAAGTWKDVRRTWTATDDCGNSVATSQTVSIKDRAPPTISGVGGSSTIECPATPQFSNPTASDTCDPNPTLSYTDVTTPGSCPQQVSITRTWIATDEVGNQSSTVSQTITVRDRVAPTISGVGASTVLEAPATPSFQTPTAQDACDPSPDLTFTDVTTPGSCPQEYTITRTWRATDACGNTSAAVSQTIQVDDRQPPVITGQFGPLTVACGATLSFGTPGVTDGGDAAPQLTYADVTTPGSCPQRYSVTRTWTATDACGNTSKASRTITVQDTAAPTWSGVGTSQTIQAPATPSFATPTATDGCDPAPAVSFADVAAPGPCVQTYTVTRTWTATDACGNSSTTSQTIAVEDRTPPVITGVGASRTIECPAPPVFDVASATDAADPAPGLTYTDVTTPGSCAPQFTVTRTWTATDACGNSTTASQTISVEDHSAPTIVGASDLVTLEAPAAPQFATPGVTDACDANATLTFTDDVTAGDCPQQVTVTRTWIATDACGNRSAPYVQVVRVEDHSAPVISGVEGPITIPCPGAPAFEQPTAGDEADPAPSLTFVDQTTASPCAQGYAVTRTWTATDACGNSSTASRTITIQDQTPPVLEGIGSPETLACPATLAFETPTARDDCDPAPTVTFADVTTPGACAQAYAVTRTWTATDACGNSTTASRTLTVEDRTPPVLSGIDGPMSIRCPTIPAFAFPAVADDCDPAPTVTFSDAGAAGTCPEGFVVTRTWIATDACGNSSSVSQTVTVLADATLGNLVGNPSFETDTEGWRGYGSATIDRVPGNRDGDFALRATGPENGNARFGIIDQPRWVEVPAAGTRYRMSAWVRSETNRGDMRIQVREYLEDSREGMVYSERMPLTSEWQQLTVDYVAASGGSKLDFMVLNYPEGPGADFMVDDISIRVTPSGISADAVGADLSRSGPVDSMTTVTLYPSPFRTRGTISFATATRGPLRVEILDLAGRRVRQLLDDPSAKPGVHRLSFDGKGDQGRPLPPGVYFYRVESPDRLTKGRFIIIR